MSAPVRWTGPLSALGNGSLRELLSRGRLDSGEKELRAQVAALIDDVRVRGDAALREMARVTRPGGRLVVCEFATPANRLFATVYKEYLMQALPRVARAVSSNPDAYVYLAESIRAWPDQSALAHEISGTGWSAVRWRNLTGGIVALHAAYKPA